jgi:hypothetical protein
MPAIQLSQLNVEISQLVKLFERPVDFFSELQELFEKYAAWSFRPGEVVKKNILLPQYYLSPLVQQKLEQALRPKCENDPQKAIELAELLWEKKYYEVRLLAISIIGLVSPTSTEAVRRKILGWSNAGENPYILSAFFSVGCQRFRTAHPIDWLDLLQNWLGGDDVQMQLVALRAILASIKDPGFSYLPNIFKMITQPLMQAQQRFHHLLHDILDTLIARAPAETSFFLHQILLRRPSQDTKRIIRRKITLFPQEYQRGLRELLTDLQDSMS